MSKVQTTRKSSWPFERGTILLPFEEVHVNLIEPWRVNVAGQEIEVLALTCVEAITNLVETI